MHWFTELSVPTSQYPISHQSKILSMGSCFAQTIGQKMKASKLDVLVNPFGTIFQPSVLSTLLLSSINQNPLNEQLILERNDSFFHYLTHSDLVGNSKGDLLKKINQQLHTTSNYLLDATHLILTLGTAWSYELKTTNTVVANCHKQPSSLFEKRLLSLEEMKNTLMVAFEIILTKNPTLNIILTVSPVRHIKDGLIENQLSKSMLRVLCSQLDMQFKNCHYFPAYEIMMDELRDYRFYKSDLIHPNEQAENHIWKKWGDTFFTSITEKKVNQITKINRELIHRPLNPQGRDHREFLQKLLIKLERLHPEFDFSEEINDIKTQITTYSL